MHYGIVAIGSRGDVQPYIALSLGLMDRGHEATVMAHENFKDLVEGYGVAFHPLQGDIEELLKTEEGLAMLRRGNILAFVRYLQKVINQTQEKVNQDLLRGCQNANVIVSSLLGIPWIESIAEKLGKPWAIVQLNLPTSPTKAFPLAALDFFHFPAYNKLTYKLLETFHWKQNKKAVNKFRQTLGLKPLKKPILRKIAEDKVLNLHCFSPSLCVRPDDWDSQIDITGFLFLPKEKRERSKQDNIPVELLRWMEDGPDPVYIGFGSIPVPDPQKFQSVLQELLHSTDHRFIFCQGWSTPMHLPQHPHFFQVKTVNHDWLFPRCKSAIIHGGVGTTAAVLKAKIPVIIVSIIADQPWWGKIIESKGVGVHIPFKKLTTQKLLAAIEDTEGLSMKREANILGEQINRENGLKKTIDALENYFV
jgi:sterol 3beta-glucosyltransferase